MAMEPSKAVKEYKNENTKLRLEVMITYAIIYELSKDKNKRQKRAEFLEKGHGLGTVNNIDYHKVSKIGENK
jgi:hypothetical protein